MLCAVALCLVAARGEQSPNAEENIDELVAAGGEGFVLAICNWQIFSNVFVVGPIAIWRVNNCPQEVLEAVESASSAAPLIQNPAAAAFVAGQEGAVGRQNAAAGQAGSAFGTGR